MELTWNKYTLLVDREMEDLFVGEVLESSYTLGWVEPQIEVLTTENGYDYAENADGPVIVYLFEPIGDSEDRLVERLRAYISRWGDAVRLQHVEQVAEENDSWKDEFREVRVGEWWIAPSWNTNEEVLTAENVLWIDPGAAFGTGYHGTTQDILRMLQKWSPAGKRVLDIGAGSGILSLFCVKNGAAKPVWAVDINQQSNYQIRVNAANNQLQEEDVTIVIGDIVDPGVEAELPDEVDLILLNIGGDEDVSILPVVDKHLATGGHVILSGIVEWNREKVIAAYEQAGFRCVEESTSDEWVTVMMEKINQRAT
ncbi:50S ribosomal protein L11 methyltransferase [Brevibacillus borstelensis]|uniref:50S ribosomal protein L11 methyltransferase n=1 Tax=Brevibacillus borstelensis TaxID=45462 RepID=UPI0030C1F594